MKLGTKSVLFGVHCFLLHPLFVALAWWKLYGFPFDPRLWIAFFVHDLGYIGKPNMDGPEGEEHVWWGAFVMGFLFGKRWFDFTLAHSRYHAKRNGLPYSRLCVADKYAGVITPRWIYLPMAKATGEIHEYVANAARRAKENEALNPGERARLVSGDIEAWYSAFRDYMGRWVEHHRDGLEDKWTAVRVQRPAELQ